MLLLPAGTWSTAGHAETVELTLPNKLVVTAEFRQGCVYKPAVPLIQGSRKPMLFPLSTGSRTTWPAKAQLVEAMESIALGAKDIGAALTKWAESKQQLTFPEHYPLWRDHRPLEKSPRANDRLYRIGTCYRSFSVLSLYLTQVVE
jgi:hypothetical protein